MPGLTVSCPHHTSTPPSHHPLTQTPQPSTDELALHYILQVVTSMLDQISLLMINMENREAQRQECSSESKDEVGGTTISHSKCCKLKSGRGRTTKDFVVKEVAWSHLGVVKEVAWPHLGVYEGSERQAAEYDPLIIPKFLAGYMDTIVNSYHTLQEETLVRLHHLRELMLDAAAYPWPNIRNYHAIVLSEMEHDRLSWIDRSTIQDLYAQYDRVKEPNTPDQAMRTNHRPSLPSYVIITSMVNVNTPGTITRHVGPCIPIRMELAGSGQDVCSPWEAMPHKCWVNKWHKKWCRDRSVRIGNRPADTKQMMPTRTLFMEYGSSPVITSVVMEGDDSDCNDTDEIDCHHWDILCLEYYNPDDFIQPLESRAIPSILWPPIRLCYTKRPPATPGTPRRYCPLADHC